MDARHSELTIIVKRWKDENVCPLAALEAMFLNAKPTDWEEVAHYELARRIYKEALTDFVRQMKAKSVQLFLALEIRDLEANITPRTKVIADRFEDIQAFVFQAVIIHDELAKCILAFERVVYLLAESIAERDFMVALALHTALDFKGLEKIRHCGLINEKALEILADADRLFDLGNGQENLRAAMVGRCIPHIGILKRSMEFLRNAPHHASVIDAGKIYKPFLVMQKIVAYEKLVQRYEPIDMTQCHRQFSWQCRFHLDSLETDELKRAAKLISLAGREKSRIEFGVIKDLWRHFANVQCGKISSLSEKAKTALNFTRSLMLPQKLVHRNLFLTAYREKLSDLKIMAQQDPVLATLLKELVGLPLLADKIAKINLYAPDLKSSAGYVQSFKELLVHEESKEMIRVELTAEQHRLIQKAFKKFNIFTRRGSPQRRPSVVFKPLDLDQLLQLESHHQSNSARTQSSRSDISSDSLSALSELSIRGERSQGSVHSEDGLKSTQSLARIKPRSRSQSEAVAAKNDCTALEYLADTAKTDSKAKIPFNK